MVALTTSQIYLMKLLILTKYVIKLIGQKFKFLCKLIGCEAQEGAK